MGDSPVYFVKAWAVITRCSTTRAFWRGWIWAKFDITNTLRTGYGATAVPCPLSFYFLPFFRNSLDFHVRKLQKPDVYYPQKTDRPQEDMRN